MMQRIRHCDGDVRRLYLLDQSPGAVAQAYREQRVMLHRLGDSDGLFRLDESFNNMAKNINVLREGGCQLRVAFDGDHYDALLPSSMHWNSRDSELAIYDDFRIDVFRGGRAGQISGLLSFSRAMENFNSLVLPTEEFFARVWDKADPMQTYLDRLQTAVASAKSRIDYWSHWLARYEFALDVEDESLKSSEADLTERVLRDKGSWGAVSRYLDVGTCTGRYLLRLRDAVRRDGIIVGIDDNLDSVLFARGNIHEHCPDDDRITIVQRDFLQDTTLIDGEFDLLTCMMGTLSHFGHDRNNRYEDNLQRALSHMARLLRPGGHLVFSTWSPEACEKGNLLSIYGKLDAARLARWTPTVNELDARLRLAGFDPPEKYYPDARLILWYCVRRST